MLNWQYYLSFQFGHFYLLKDLKVLGVGGIASIDQPPSHTDAGMHSQELNQQNIEDLE